MTTSDPSSGDLPEGVIDADPAGGWESSATADGETDEQSAEAAGSPGLTTAAHDAESAAAAAGPAGDVPDGPVAPDGPVESARLEAEMDPDLSTENPDDLQKEQ